MVLILNAGGVLALLTAAGALISQNRSLEPLIQAANIFIGGLIVAALGTLVAVWFFNYFSKWTHDLHRDVVNDRLTWQEEEGKDTSMSILHTLYQRILLGLIILAFVAFVVGTMASLDAVEQVTKPIPNEAASCEKNR